jgi:hypothetical protein
VKIAICRVIVTSAMAEQAVPTAPARAKQGRAAA